MEAIGNEVIVAIIFMMAPILLLVAYFWNNIKEFYLQQIADVEVVVEEPPHRQQIRRQRNDNACSICLNEPKEFEVSSTCGHSFCGECIFHIYERNEGQKIKCPLCRNDMSILFKCYHEQLSSERGEALSSKIKNYNLLFSDNRPLLRRLLQLPYVLKSLFRYIFSARFLVFFLRNVYFVRLIFLSVFYLILPFDLLPQRFVGLIGLIDDLLIILILGGYIVAIVAVQYYRVHH